MGVTVSFNSNTLAQSYLSESQECLHKIQNICLQSLEDPVNFQEALRDSLEIIEWILEQDLDDREETIQRLGAVITDNQELNEDIYNLTLLYQDQGLYD